MPNYDDYLVLKEPYMEVAKDVAMDAAMSKAGAWTITFASIIDDKIYICVNKSCFEGNRVLNSFINWKTTKKYRFFSISFLIHKTSDTSTHSRQYTHHTVPGFYLIQPLLYKIIEKLKQCGDQYVKIIYCSEKHFVAHCNNKNDTEWHLGSFSLLSVNWTMTLPTVMLVQMYNSNKHKKPS